jgi:hypothetical protein
MLNLINKDVLSNRIVELLIKLTRRNRESVDREFHKLIASASRNLLRYRFVCVVLELMIKKRQQSIVLPNAVQIAN